MVRKIIQKDYKKLNKSIYEFWNTRRRMPTFEELKDIFDVRSKDTVSRIINDLINMGHILKDKTGKLLPVADDIIDTGLQNKNIKNKFQKIVRDFSSDFNNQNNMLSLKMLGTVEAGFPTHVDAQDLDTVKFEEWLIGDTNATFMLKVSGNSMLEAGIFPGDFVIVERGKDPKNNDIVLAEVDNAWTLKYYKKDKSGIFLMPANKNFKTIYPKNELTIAAIVVAVVRKY